MHCPTSTLWINEYRNVRYYRFFAVGFRYFWLFKYRRQCRFVKISDIGRVFQYTDPWLLYDNRQWYPHLPHSRIYLAKHYCKPNLESSNHLLYVDAKTFWFYLTIIYTFILWKRQIVKTVVNRHCFVDIWHDTPTVCKECIWSGGCNLCLLHTYFEFSNQAGITVVNLVV